MSIHIVSVATLALQLFFVSATAWPATHDGTVVSITGDQLVMASKEGQKHSHTLTSDAKLTLDGKTCQAADLRPGTKIRVTTQGPDNSVATRIEGLDRNPNFAASRHDGQIVSIAGNKLVITSLPDKELYPCTLAANAKITRDGKTCKASDLKPGMKVRVMLQSSDPHTAAQVEALDKNRHFVSF